MEFRFKFSEVSVSFLSALLMVGLYLGFADFQILKRLEGAFLDLRFQVRGIVEPSNPIAIVQIDEKSIQELGRWPWSRQIFATIVNHLHNNDAKLIVLDLLFSETQGSLNLSPIEKLRQSFESDNTIAAREGIQKLDEVMRTVKSFDDQLNPDNLLSIAINNAGNVLLPYSFGFLENNNEFNKTDSSSLEKFKESSFKTVRYIDGQKPNFGLIAKDVLPPISVLTNSALTMGHVNVALDADGVNRYSYPVIRYRDEYYPSLSLQVARKFLGYGPEEMRVEFNEGIQLGKIWIPTDDSMRLITNFHGPNKTFPIYSVVDVLAGRIPKSAFAGKIILLGASAVGVVDSFVTPFSAVLTGTERLATVIDNILNQESVLRRNFMWMVEITIALIGSVLLGLASARLSPYYLSLFALSLGLIYAASNALAFSYGNVWLNLMLPLMTWITAYSCIMIFRFFTQERDARKLRDAFGKYLSPELVDLLCENPSLLKLGGEKRKLTVLFMDVRDFSTIAENMPPERLVPLINEFLTVMSNIVVETGGLLDKYAGDSVMAVYGAPYPLADHAAKACEAAVRMIEATEALNKSSDEIGRFNLKIGIGVNTGDMIIGNIGSQDHFNYTVMGDEVNIAARLEPLNKIYGTSILISKETHELAASGFSFRELDECVVKGRHNPVQIFELLDRGELQGERAEGVMQFETGLDHYRDHLWEAASGAFKQAKDSLGGDAPSQLFIERCEHLMVTPMPESWDGYIRNDGVTSVTRTLHDKAFDENPKLQLEVGSVVQFGRLKQ
ncbi:MAG: adenylate/guanylate cyclase domain-containing protein [Rhodospirillales bacterium]|nr:adenylate/guanylate cyclase domain-containing protein [Rhodospirillales bacterium]